MPILIISSSIIFLAALAVFVYFLIDLYFFSQKWISAIANVTTSEIEEDHDSGGETFYLNRIDFKYHIDSKSYTGSTANFGRGFTYDLKEAQDVQKRYVKDQPLEILYNVRHPEKAIIKEINALKYQRSGLTGGIIFCFLLSALSGFYLLFLIQNKP